MDGAAHALLDGTPPPDLAACILVAEQRFRDLSAIAQAERLGLAAARNEALRRRMLVLEGCELWARELGQIGLQSFQASGSRAGRGWCAETVARIDEAVIEVNNRATNRSANGIPTSNQPAHRLWRRATTCLARCGCCCASKPRWSISPRADHHGRPSDLAQRNTQR